MRASRSNVLVTDDIQRIRQSSASNTGSNRFNSGAGQDSRLVVRISQRQGLLHVVLHCHGTDVLRDCLHDGSGGAVPQTRDASRLEDVNQGFYCIVQGALRILDCDGGAHDGLVGDLHQGAQNKRGKGLCKGGVGAVVDHEVLAHVRAEEDRSTGPGHSKHGGSQTTEGRLHNGLVVSNQHIGTLKLEAGLSNGTGTPQGEVDDGGDTRG